MEPEARAFIEEAINALGSGDVPLARTAVGQAYAADHKLSALADIVYLACWELEERGEVTTSSWNALADAVAGTGELLASVEANRTA